MSADENNEVVDVCKDILLALLANRQPDEVQAELAGRGISGEDGQNLINATIVSFQEVSPVIEQRIPLSKAISALTEQGMERNLAASMAQMVIAVMGERASNAVEEKAGASDAPVINEAQMKILMRLSLVVDADLQRGVPTETVAAAIDKISDIDSLPDVKGHSMEFVRNVKLARAAAGRTKAGMQLPQVIRELGLDKQPPYAAVLALFFLKLTNSPAPGPAGN